MNENVWFGFPFLYYPSCLSSVLASHSKSRGNDTLVQPETGFPLERCGLRSLFDFIHFIFLGTLATGSVLF